MCVCYECLYCVIILKIKKAGDINRAALEINIDDMTILAAKCDTCPVTAAISPSNRPIDDYHGCGSRLMHGLIERFVSYVSIGDRCVFVNCHQLRLYLVV